jgi:hypothetical protein
MSAERAHPTSDQERNSNEQELKQAEAEEAREENDARIIEEAIEGPPVVVPRW